MSTLKLREIAARLRDFDPELVDDTPRQAAVALLLREGERGLEVFVIQRAEKAGDPWSGHMALPGGRREPDDATVYETARRETLEEVGMDIAPGEYLGRLDDLAPRLMPGELSISTVVVALDEEPGELQSSEVRAAFWVPVSELIEGPVEFDGWPGRWPAFTYEDDYIIWGLTHRILTRLRELNQDGRNEDVTGE